MFSSSQARNDYYTTTKGTVSPRHHVMTVASAKTVEEASPLALEDMVELLTEKTSLSREEAYALSGAVAEVKIANLVDPDDSVRVTVPKYVFKQAKRKQQSRINETLRSIGEFHHPSFRRHEPSYCVVRHKTAW